MFRFTRLHVLPDLLPLRRSAPLWLGAAAVGLGDGPMWALSVAVWMGAAFAGWTLAGMMREGR